MVTPNAETIGSNHPDSDDVRPVSASAGSNQATLVATAVGKTTAPSPARTVVGPPERGSSRLSIRPTRSPPPPPVTPARACRARRRGRRIRRQARPAPPPRMRRFPLRPRESGSPAAAGAAAGKPDQQPGCVPCVQLLEGLSPSTTAPTRSASLRASFTAQLSRDPAAP